MMRRSAQGLVAGAVLALWLAGPAAAVRAWMQEAQLRGELVGRQLTGVYPGGMAWRELIDTAGTSVYEEHGLARPGRWTIKGELFCFAYAPPTMGGCFRLVKHSANCYELYTASIGGHMPKDPPSAQSMSWNGRLWREAERATCEDKPIS